MKKALLISFLFLNIIIAQNGNYSDFGSIGDYNVFVLQNANLKSADAQGKIAVGGSGRFSNGFSVGDQLNLSDPPENILVVGDSLFYNSGVVYNGNVVYAEFASTSSLDIPQGELIQGNPLDFPALALLAGDISRQWQAIATNGSKSIANNKITLSGNNLELNVFDISADELNSANNIEIISPVGATVLVNVSGDSVNWSGGLTLTGGDQTKVVYNFFEASKIYLSGIEVKGSILAPFADTKFNSGVIYGNTIVYSLRGEGQYNNSLFTGKIQYTPQQVSSECTVTIKKILVGKSFRVSPPFAGHSSLWAGTFLGYFNDHSTTFYCVDISHWLRFNKEYEFDKVISGKINYIVNNYYPNLEFTGENGQLHNEREEAAAVQAAIWHFSDGFDPANISNNSRIKSRALEIIADAEDKNTSSEITFEIRPTNLLLMNGATGTFTVFMRDAEGNPVEDAEVFLSSDGGNISPESGKTDASGAFVFTVEQSAGESSIEITAESFQAILPPASRFKYPNAQTLVTNYPVVSCLSTKAKVYFSEEPLPGSAYSFFQYNGQNSSIPENYIADVWSEENKIYTAFNSKGIGIFNRNDESWTELNTDNVDEFTTNSFTKIFKFESGDHQGDWVAGSDGHGFFYYNSTEGTYTKYDPSTTFGTFTGSKIHGFAHQSSGNKEYLWIAHSSGVSKFDLESKEFTNYNTSNSDFPGGNSRCVQVDNDGNVWAGSDYGLAYTTDGGTSWEVFNKDNSDLTGDIITALASGSSKIFVGTWNSGLYEYDLNNSKWQNLSAHVSAQPITALLFKNDKLFIGNYDHGLYVYDGENFSQYLSVNHFGSPDIINAVSFDGVDLWFATQSGLSRTTNGINASYGNASIVIDDKTIHIGGSTTLAVKLVPDEDIEINRLEGTLVYNQNELEYQAGNYGELLSGWTIYSNTSTPGRLSFRAIAGEPITTEGTLFYLTFKVKDELSGGGLSAVYATSFKSGLNNELEHSDLGIITFTSEGTGNAGEGDANLDGQVDISDLIIVSNESQDEDHSDLSDEQFNNSDVDDDDDIDTEDCSDLLSYIQTGVFRSEDDDDEHHGDVDNDDLDFDDEDGDDDDEDDGSVIIPIGLNGGENVSSVQVTVEYDPDQLSFASYSTNLLRMGNFVTASETQPGRTVLNYIAPTNGSGSFNLSNLVFNLGNNALGSAVVTTSYSINGGPAQTGPAILVTGINEDKDQIPTKFELSQNYPNPFNPETIIKVSLPVATNIELSVYNILGQKVEKLFEGKADAGIYNFKWDASRFASGVYFYKLISNNVTMTKKMVLLK